LEGEFLMSILSKSLKTVGAVSGFLALVVVSRIVFVREKEARKRAKEKETSEAGMIVGERTMKERKQMKWILGLVAVGLAFQIVGEWLD
jgi:hypothetical protein